MATTTRSTTPAPVDLLRDWDITPKGEFKNKVDKRTLSRQDWEVEMAYEHYHNDDALALAKVLAEQAGRMAEESRKDGGK